MPDQKESHPNLAVSSAPDAIQAPTLSQSFLDSIPLCVLVVNPDLRIIQTNRRAPFFFEEPERMIGHYIWKICFNDYDVGTLRMYFNTHAEHPLQLVIKGREKSPVPVRIYASHHDGLILVFVEDRSELYLVEEELRNFRTAVQFAGDAIFLFDDKGMIFFTNPAFERQVGCSTEEIIGKNVHDFWTSQVPAIVFQSLWDHIKNGKTWAGELKCMQRGSGVLHVEVGIRPIFNDTHLLLAHVCVQRDITDRKRMERLLSEYSDNLQRLVDERTDALSKLHEISQLFHTTETLEKRLRLILIAVTAGETFGFNRAFLLLYNPYKDMLQGKIAIGPSTPEEAGRVWNKIQTLPNDGTIQGRLETYLYHANQIDEMANAIVKHLAVPMANAESILVKALELDRSFIVNQGQSVVQFDPAIMEDLGTDSFAVIPLVVRDAWIGVMVVDNVITREVITNEDVKMLDILATQAALAIAHANTMEELARKVKEIEFAYSELRHSQEQLIETSKFAALGQMAATVAHEIRTPLVAIGGFANMLKNKFSQKEDAKTTHYIEIISEEAMRLENVLNRLLFYARPSTPTLVRQD
ncbi:MAG: PAS domain-containing protein, partial [bacterium]|nr:PAS domain-containing protein [bacterium]